MPLLNDKLGGDIDPKPVTAAKTTDAVSVKAYLETRTKIKTADISKQVWAKPEDIIASTVKLHGGTLEGYKNSGLG
jgi:hypothetical protein